MPDRRPRAQRHQQQIPDRNGRQNQRQMNDTVQDGLAAKAAPRQHQGAQEGQRQVGQYGRQRHLEAQG